MTDAISKESPDARAHKIVTDLCGVGGDCYVQAHSPNTGHKLERMIASAIRSARDDERERWAVYCDRLTLPIEPAKLATLLRSAT